MSLNCVGRDDNTSATKVVSITDVRRLALLRLSFFYFLVYDDQHNSLATKTTSKEQQTSHSVSKKGKHKKTKAAGTKQRRSVRKTQKKRSSARPLVLGLLAAIVLIGVGFMAWPYLAPVPEVVRPQNEGALDAAVAEFIAPKIKAVEENPGEANRHADLALAYEANGLWNEARESYQNAIDLGDDRLEVHLHHALATRQAGGFDDALTMLKELAEEDDSSAPLMHRLAEGLLEAGEVDAAEEAFRRLQSLQPAAIQGPVGLADIALQRQQPETAIAILEEAVRTEPDYKKAHYLLGSAYTMVGREVEAESALRRGSESSTVFLSDGLSERLASYAVNVTGRLDFARAYLEAGQPQEAARILENTFQHHASNTMVLNTLATAYLRSNRLDDAHRLLLRARELDADQFFTYLNLYQWALRKNDMEQALSFADQAVERAPERDDTHLARAQVLNAMDRYDEALVSADKARELDDLKPPNHAIVGRNLFSPRSA